MLSECILLVRLGYGQTAPSASVVGMVDRFPMMLSFEAASRRPHGIGRSCGLSIWTFDELECGNVRASQQRL